MKLSKPPLAYQCSFPQFHFRYTQQNIDIKTIHLYFDIHHWRHSCELSHCIHGYLCAYAKSGANFRMDGLHSDVMWHVTAPFPDHSSMVQQKQHPSKTIPPWSNKNSTLPRPFLDAQRDFQTLCEHSGHLVVIRIEIKLALRCNTDMVAICPWEHLGKRLSKNKDGLPGQIGRAWHFAFIRLETKGFRLPSSPVRAVFRYNEFIWIRFISSSERSYQTDRLLTNKLLRPLFTLWQIVLLLFTIFKIFDSHLLS